MIKIVIMQIFGAVHTRTQTRNKKLSVGHRKHFQYNLNIFVSQSVLRAKSGSK